MTWKQTPAPTGTFDKVDTLETVSQGEHWFEWTVNARCQAVQISVVARRGYIKELLLNGQQVPVTFGVDPECCNVLTLAPEFMLNPQDKLRIVARAPRGAKILAHLKFSWPS